MKGTYMPNIWGQEMTEEEVQRLASELNRPRTGLNYEKLGEQLRRVANNMERVGNIARIMEKAKSENPRGLLF
jgi:hypothetical protein